MTDRGGWYADLVLATLVTALSAAGVYLDAPGYLRYLAAAPLVLFVPGYALVAVLFPASAEAGETVTAFDDPNGHVTEGLASTHPDGVARLALSVLLSVSLLSVVTLGANVTPRGVTLEPVLGGIVAVTGLSIAVAAVRRLRCHPDDRFSVSLRGTGLAFAAGRSRIGSNPTWERTVPNAALAVGVLLLCASVGYAAVAPPTPQGFTEFYVETGDQTIDTRTLYPDSYARGSAEPLDVHVGNYEGERTRYTAVAVLQRVAYDANGGVTVRAREEVARTGLAVPAGATRTASLDLQPTMTGSDLRLVVLLYRGDPPATPGVGSAYRVLRLGVDVSGGSPSNATATARLSPGVGS